MSAVAARFVHKIWVNPATGAILVGVSDGSTVESESVEYLEDLSKVEAVRCLSQYLRSHGGKFSRSMTLGEVNEAVSAIVRAPGYVPHEWIPSAPVAPLPSWSASPPVVAPSAPPSDPVAVALADIQTILQSVASTGASVPADLLERLERLEVETVGVVIAISKHRETLTSHADFIAGHTERLEALEAHAVRPLSFTIGERPTVTLQHRTHAILPRAVAFLSRGKIPFLFGPAGTGKSTIAEHAAEALSVPFAAVSLHPGMGAHELFGFPDATSTVRRTAFRDCYENGGLFLFDEVDNGAPETLAAMNSALAQSWAMFPDGLVKRHKDFRAIFTGNTPGFGATASFTTRAALDLSTLDRASRFFVGIDPVIERAMLDAAWADATGVATWHALIQVWRANADAHKIVDISLSPRRSTDYATLRDLGESHDEAAEAAVFAGVPAAKVAKITGASF